MIYLESGTMNKSKEEEFWRRVDHTLAEEEALRTHLLAQLSRGVLDAEDVEIELIDSSPPTGEPSPRLAPDN